MSKIIKINRKIKKAAAPFWDFSLICFYVQTYGKGLMLPARPCLLDRYGFIVSVLRFEHAALAFCWSLRMLPTLAPIYCLAVFYL